MWSAPEKGQSNKYSWPESHTEKLRAKEIVNELSESTTRIMKRKQ